MLSVGAAAPARPTALLAKIPVIARAHRQRGNPPPKKTPSRCKNCSGSALKRGYSMYDLLTYLAAPACLAASASLASSSASMVAIWSSIRTTWQL